MIEMLDDNNNIKKITDDDINKTNEEKMNSIIKGGVAEKEDDDVFHYMNNDLKISSDRAPSEHFSFTIGVTPGYNHNNENSDIGIIPILKKVQNEVEKETGIFISCTIIPSTIIYKEEWGCPSYGEKVFEISSIRNPIFEKDKWKWRKACELIAEKMAIELKQCTVTAYFSSAYVYYIKNNNLS